MGKLLGGRLKEDFWLKEEIRRVGDGEGLVEIVVGYENRDIGVFEVGENVVNMLEGNRV